MTQWDETSGWQSERERLEQREKGNVNSMRCSHGQLIDGHRRPGAWHLAIVACVSALTVAGCGGDETETVTETRTATVAPPKTDTGESHSAAKPKPKYLSTLIKSGETSYEPVTDDVEIDDSETFIATDTGAEKIGRITYRRSVAFNGDNGSRGYGPKPVQAEFPVPPRATRFVVDLGVAADSDASRSVSVEFRANTRRGKLLMRTRAYRAGQSAVRKSMPLPGVNKIIVRISAPDESAVKFVLGDARFTE